MPREQPQEPPLSIYPRRPLARFCGLASLLMVLALPAATRAQVSSQLVNGMSEFGEPSTMGLIQGTVPEDGHVVCSGVLIGCDSAITTAHCFNTNVSLKTHLYIPHAGFYEIESATRHPAYVDAITNQPEGWLDITREQDITFVKLLNPVVGVTPASIVTGGAPGIGTAGLIVGFGRDPVTEASYENPGIKRSGSMQLAACTNANLVDLDVLCWEPTGPYPTPGTDVTTCTGDSGGPLFTFDAGNRVVSGITKGAFFDPQGQGDLCLPPVHPYDVSVQRQATWIGGVNGAGGMVATTGAVPLWTKQCSSSAQLPELTTVPGPCDPSPWNPGEQARTCGFQAVLGGANPVDAEYSFGVPAGTETLRVAVNGISSASASVDTDLYVRKGQRAKKQVNDCAVDGTGTLGICEFALPGADTWHVLVDQDLGEGDHQLIVTLLGPDPPPMIGVPALGIAARGFLLFSLAGAAWLVDRRRRAHISTH